MTFRVLHAIYSLETGGAETVLVNYARAHDRQRFSMAVCATQRSGKTAAEIEKAGVPVFVLGRRSKAGKIWELRGLLRQEGIDILHVHNPMPNILGVPAAMLAGGVPVVRTEHNLFYDGRVHRLFPPLNMALGLFNRRIIAVSDAVKASHVRKDPLSRRKYLTVYNGIEVARFGGDVDAAPYRREWRIPPDAPVVGIVASLTPQKGHQHFLAMARRVLESEPRARFLVVGDGPLREQLTAMAGDLGIAASVTFTGVRTDVPALMRVMDVFVLSSLWEGFPMTVLEAMAAGTAVAVTAVGGNAEAVVDGVTGRLTPPADPGRQAAAVLALIADPALRARLGDAGARRVRELFSVEAMVRRTEDLYREILEERRGARRR